MTNTHDDENNLAATDENLDVTVQKMSISSGASKSLYSMIGRGSLRRLKQIKSEKKWNHMNDHCHQKGH